MTNLVRVVAATLLVSSVLSLDSSPAAQRHESTKDWFETATFYQIYPRSFADSDGDGIGDINGIISKLHHLKDLGVEATWISPIFKSPMADFGYDISDFYEIDPLFGTMADLERLFVRAKELGIKVILDFVPNHSSDKSVWFERSVLRDPIYTDYYVWHDGKLLPNGTRVEPNNWNSVFRGHAWTWNDVRKQYYLHQFEKGQPDLNYRNPAVVAEMQNVLRFWLKKGADGFRVDAISFMFEVADFRDEPINEAYASDPLNYFYTYKHFTQDLPETYDVVFDWRQLLDEYRKENGGDTRVMMTEAFSNQSLIMDFYGKNGREGAQMPFNFLLILELNIDSTADDFLRTITTRLAANPPGKVANWVLGNHDQPRVGSRYGVERIDALLMLVMTLPGIAVTYMGEEIGMVDNRDGISFEQTVDPPGLNAGPDNYKRVSRDPERTPFQWDNSNVHAGFSNGTVAPWLPVHPNYKWLNLQQQKEARFSTYKFYKELMALRRDHTFMDGSFEGRVVSGNVLSYVRALADHETYLVLINFDSVENVVNVSADFAKHFGSSGRLEVVCGGANTFLQKGDFVDKNAVYLRKHETVILRSSAAALEPLSIAVVLLSFLIVQYR